MRSSDWKKKVEVSIKDGLIITTTKAGIFYVLKGANVKPPKAPSDAMDTMKLAGGGCPCQGLCSLQRMDQRVIQQQKCYGP